MYDRVEGGPLDADKNSDLPAWCVLLVLLWVVLLSDSERNFFLRLDWWEPWFLRLFFLPSGFLSTVIAAGQILLSSCSTKCV